MDLLEAIRDRRSVRAFAGGASRTEIEELLRLAVLAPSAMNAQPWAFAVVEDRALLQRISDRAKAHLLKIAGALGRPAGRCVAGGYYLDGHGRYQAFVTY